MAMRSSNASPPTTVAYESRADLFRQIRYDERVRKEDSLAV